DARQGRQPGSSRRCREGCRRLHDGRGQVNRHHEIEKAEHTMSTATHAHDHAHDDHGQDHGPPAGFTRWMYTTNHKDIGTMYLWFAGTMFLIGGMMALVIRAELFQPGLQFVDPVFFNSLTTVHGLVMVFGAIMPAFVGFANW